MILSELRAQGWKYGCIAALVALLAATGTAGVQTYRVAVAKGATAILARDWAQATATAAEAMTRASEAARAEEQTRARAMESVDKAYQRGFDNGKATASKLLADRDAGRVVLRDRFRCPARSAGTPATGPAGSGDGGEGAVLSRADQDFLVRLAEEADRNTLQLAACQEVIRVYTDDQHASRPGD